MESMEKMEQMISLKNTAVIILTIGVWALLITVWMYPGK